MVQKADGELQCARVICGFTHQGKRFEPDDIFEGPASEVWLWERTGNLDPHPDAVAYALAHPRVALKLDKPAFF